MVHSTQKVFEISQFKLVIMRLFYGLLKPGMKNEQKCHLDLQSQKLWSFYCHLNK